MRATCVQSASSADRTVVLRQYDIHVELAEEESVRMDSLSLDAPFDHGKLILFSLISVLNSERNRVLCSLGPLMM